MLFSPLLVPKEGLVGVVAEITPCKTLSILTLFNIKSSKHNVFSPLLAPKEGLVGVVA